MKMNSINEDKSKTILLIHPMLSSSEAMKLFIADYLGDDYHYLIPDLANHATALDQTYKSAKIEAKDAAGNPILWSFELPSEEEYFDVVVNPHVEIMGNADIAARMKVDYSTLKYVSDQIDAPKAPETNGSTSTGNNTTTPETSGNDAVVKTGDNANVELIGGLLVSSLAIAGYVIRKRLCK